MLLRTVACFVTFWFIASGFDGDGSKTLTGTWTAAADNGGSTGWVFEQKGDSLGVAEMRGAEKTTEFECNTVGRECEFKDNGKKVTLSMWYNGPKLVQIEIRGPQVVKRRFAMSASGDELEVEVIPVSPPGKAETLRYKRTAIAVQGK